MQKIWQEQCLTYILLHLPCCCPCHQVCDLKHVSLSVCRCATARMKVSKVQRIIKDLAKGSTILWKVRKNCLWRCGLNPALLTLLEPFQNQIIAITVTPQCHKSKDCLWNSLLLPCIPRHSALLCPYLFQRNVSFICFLDVRKKRFPCRSQKTIRSGQRTMQKCVMEKHLRCKRAFTKGYVSSLCVCR